MGQMATSMQGRDGQWARYFFKVPAVSVLENQKYRAAFVGTFHKQFQKESTALHFVDFQLQL